MHSPTATLLALRLSMLPRTSLRLCSTQRETLELLKLPELKEKLRAAGLPVSGRKASLVSRLLEVSAPTEGVVAERSAPTTPTLDHPPPSPTSPRHLLLKDLLRDSTPMIRSTRAC